MTASDLEQWKFKMHLNRNLRAALSAMSIEELATKYVLITTSTTQGGGLLKPQDLHYELCLRVGVDGAKTKIAQAEEVLKMVGHKDEVSPDPRFF